MFLFLMESGTQEVFILRRLVFVLALLDKRTGLNSPKTSHPSPFVSPAWLELRSYFIHFCGNEFLIPFFSCIFGPINFVSGSLSGVLSSGQLFLHLIYFPSCCPTAGRSNGQELKEIKNIFFLFTLCDRILYLFSLTVSSVQSFGFFPFVQP